LFIGDIPTSRKITHFCKLQASSPFRTFSWSINFRAALDKVYAVSGAASWGGRSRTRYLDEFIKGYLQRVSSLAIARRGVLM